MNELLVKTPNSAWPTELAGRPLILVMTSPATMPATAASVFGITGQKHEIGRHYRPSRRDRDPLGRAWRFVTQVASGQIAFGFLEKNRR